VDFGNKFDYGDFNMYAMQVLGAFEELSISLLSRPRGFNKRHVATWNGIIWHREPLDHPTSHMQLDRGTYKTDRYMPTSS
jgi:hypothetical protein